MLDKIVTALTPEVSLEAKLTGVAVTIGTEVADIQSRLLTQEIRAFQKGDKGDKGDRGATGPAGKDGKDGRNGKDGKDGKDAPTPKDGKDGVSVVSADITADDHLTLMLSNGVEIDAGSLSDILVNTKNTIINTTGVIPDVIPSIQFDTSSSVASQPGLLTWNDVDGTLNLGLKGGNVTLQIGQEQVARVVNKATIDLLESNYQVVKVIGATGQRLSVDLAQANNDLNSASTLGVVTETIAKNQQGFVTTEGAVNDIDTTGALQGETWVDGDLLYLSSTIAGRLTNIKPIAPAHTIRVGYVSYAHALHGRIFVKVDNGYELEELHNVLVTAPADGQVLVYESATSLWKNKSAAASAITSAEVELDFGATATRAASFTVTDATVTATTLILMTASGNAPTGRSADEVSMESFTISCLPSAGSFLATINSLQGAVTGKYKFNYLRT